MLRIFNKLNEKVKEFGGRIFSFNENEISFLYNNSKYTIKSISKDYCEECNSKSISQYLIIGELTYQYICEECLIDSLNNLNVSFG